MSLKLKSGFNKMTLTIIIGGSVLLSFLFRFLADIFERARNPGVEFSEAYVKENYLYSLLMLVVIWITAFLLGFVSWLVFRHRKPGKLFYFIIFNFLGILLLFVADVTLGYRIWHYNKYQANIDHNEAIATRTGVYLDTCMLMVENQIKKRGLSLNDFRILSYDYDRRLATIPKDTSNRFYSIVIFYSADSSGQKRVRAAGYLVNFNHKIKEVYDVDISDRKAEKQVKSLRKNLDDLKDLLAKFPDSSDKSFEELKKGLK